MSDQSEEWLAKQAQLTGIRLDLSHLALGVRVKVFLSSGHSIDGYVCETNDPGILCLTPKRDWKRGDGMIVIDTVHAVGYHHFSEMNQ